ncbi:MAG: adenylate/guanylate cyclase domain-containing protein [Pseudolabrys sp.]
MADVDRSPIVSIDPQYFPTGEVVERPPSERPKHDTIDAIIDWLGGPAGQIPSLIEEFDEFAWRMMAAGFPLLRTTFHLRTLHPQYLGATFVWWRTTGQTVQTFVTHEAQDLYGHEDNPVRRVLVGGDTLRRRVDVADDELDFPILRDLKAAGATDYFALPVKSSFGTNYMVTYVTDRISGFTAQEISDLKRVTRRLPLLADLRNHRRIASNILNAYLGPKTGPKVLAGQIRRGAGEEITAVLWSSDLRGFTERSDRLAGSQVIAMLNALFDAQAQAIATHGGEILKFIGDGLLGIFPIEHADKAATAARCALDAAMQAVEAARGLMHDPPLVDEPPLEIVVALHIGTVIYGNIGAADRLDFTVIGPAVNLVSRIESVAKALNLPIVVSDDFARAYGEPLRPLGRHQLRGLAAPHDLFAPTAAVVLLPENSQK